MYFLNDFHNNFQYGIYRINNNGKPFINDLKFIYNDSDLKNYLYEISKRFERYHQSYFIDFPSFSNNYQKDNCMFYIKPLKRKINDWEEF